MDSRFIRPYLTEGVSACRHVQQPPCRAIVFNELLKSAAVVLCDQLLVLGWLPSGWATRHQSRPHVADSGMPTSGLRGGGNYHISRLAWRIGSRGQEAAHCGSAPDQVPQKLSDGSATWRVTPPLNKPRATPVDTGPHPWTRVRRTSHHVLLQRSQNENTSLVTCYKRAISPVT